MSKKTILRFALALFLLAQAPAQQASKTPPADLMQAADDFRQALLKADIHALSQILTDDFLRTPPTRPSTTKAEYLDQLKSGTLKYLVIEVKEAKYQVYGGAAIENSVAALQVTYNDRPINEQLRLLHVWVKINGKWRLAAVQGNPVPAA